MSAYRRKRGRAKVLERDGYRCVQCGASKNLTIDHILPKFKGGTDGYSNLRTLCNDCATIKSRVEAWEALQRDIDARCTHGEDGAAVVWCDSCRRAIVDESYALHTIPAQSSSLSVLQGLRGSGVKP